MKQHIAIKSNHAIRYGFVLLLFFNSALINSQNISKYWLQKISVEKGLSQSVVTGIAQDSLGFMWFCTLDGVNRYDGYHFINFYNQKGNPYSLSNNFTNAILCDNHNQIWVATLDGLCRFDYKTERFKVFQHEPNNSASISHNEITCLAQLKAGNICVGTNGGLNIYDIRSNIFSHFMYHPAKDPASRISALCADSKDNLWVGVMDAGLYRIEIKTKTIFHIVFSADPAVSQLYTYIRCIYQDPYGDIWIGTSNGLIRFNVHRNKFQFFTNDPKSPCSINGNIITTITCDSENHLWVGTQENGLNIVNLSTLDTPGSNVCFQQIRMSENEYGLSIRSVNAVFEDRDRNMWIGTYSGGINFISSLSKKFQKYQHNPFDNNTIGYPKVWGLCEDKYGNIWIGTDGAGLDMLNPVTNKIAHFRHDKNNAKTISDNAILCALKDSRNNLWFGTYAGGLNRYNENSKSFTVYRSVQGDSNSIPANDIRALYEDIRHNLWIATNGGGLCKYNPDRNNFKVYNTSNSPISSNDIRAILSDNTGNLYIGTYSKGLDILNLTTGRFLNYSHQRDQSNSISDNYIFAIALAKNDNVWVGTTNGLNLFHPSSGTFETFNENNGLINNYIHAILTDKNGDLWISSNKGISKFIVAERKFQNYDAYDGLQNGEFNDGSALLARNGLMWFGGINGLNSFDPEKVSKSSFQPKIVICGLQLYNTETRARTPENPESPLESSISTVEKIRLNHRQSVFTIDFVALNYSFPEKTLYRYKLNGADRDWNEAGTRRSATYRDLPAGKYVFEVKASNEDGLWLGQNTSLEIIILPPFWKTWWAYTIYTILFALLGYIIVLYYRKENALKNKLLFEQISRKKEEELNQEKLRFFTNISHEFRTPLTLIIGPLESIIEKETKHTQLGRQLHLIYKNANKLLDLINLLLDFRKAETGNMKLNIARGNIVKFAKEIGFVYREYAKQKNIEFHFITSSEEIELWFDREKLEIIFNNLLSNAFKYTSKEGIVTIEISEGESKLSGNVKEVAIIKVTDTGIGINEKYLSNIFENYYSLNEAKGYKGTGIGLALTKSLVGLHKGEISVESTEGKGTSFIMEFIKGKEHFDPDSVSTGFKNSEDPVHYQNKRKGLIESALNAVEVVNEEEADLQQSDLKQLLIVEDNVDVRTYIKENFAKHYRILEASNGVEGFDLAIHYIPDIIISDVMMPEMDGIEFCNKIKSAVTTCHIPVILLTARTSVTHKKEGYATGADSYVTKPFSIDLLESRVENILKSRQLLKDYYVRIMLNQLPQAEAQTPDEKFMKRMFELVEKYMKEPDFDVTKLSQELNMSRPVLYRKVKALTDLSVVEFIRTVRMNKAAQLLKTGQFRVSEVAFEVGFNDAKYFAKCFKKQFNMSPSDLTNNHDT